MIMQFLFLEDIQHYYSVIYKFIHDIPLFFILKNCNILGYIRLKAERLLQQLKHKNTSSHKNAGQLLDNELRPKNYEI